MDFKFINDDLSCATFEGVSSSNQRRVAVMATIFIWLALGYFAIVIANGLDEALSNAIALSGFTCVIVHYIVFGKNLFLTASHWLFNLMPLSVLVERDLAILEKARQELLLLSAQIDFTRYLEYSKYNPKIRSRSSLLVMAHQSRGDLEIWVSNPKNLNLLANLVHQIKVAEASYKEDSPG